ncbi:polysaccharide deacetylase family protein [Paenibacillus humicola]|uniref:polysaccharide deacetylase family protein n=1 Tax=Paenibacillus humicola TaxID=3110540 RepID=UPI00237BB08F|nr:polysaccharide deacetylase family protein [Paenibacillus humicola]
METADSLNKSGESDSHTVIKHKDTGTLEKSAVKTGKLEPKPYQSPKKSSTARLVAYNGIVEHIFFHPLIAYPQLAFDNDSLSKGYNDWFTTIPEFKRILGSLYKNDFILIHLEDVYEEKTVDGKKIMIKKNLMLPKGKKPLVISIDDLNYYSYMIENGNVYKLVLDSESNVASYSKNPQGEEIVSRDNEIIPILDRFVESHPDFSLDGAKGVIALTGYEGILGYRTQSGSPNRETEKIEALKVVNRLKETGWTFGSHSYGHIDVSSVTLNKLKQDTARWKREVEPLIGPTPLYFYPYGSRVDYGSAKFNFLVNSGYKVISAVGPTSYTKVIDGAYTMDRRHMDGIAIIQQPKTVRDLFDAGYVLDKENRPAMYWRQYK